MSDADAESGSNGAGQASGAVAPGTASSSPSAYDRVALTPVGQEHAEAVAALLDDPDVQHFTPLPAPAPAGFASRWIADYVRARAEGSREMFAVVDPDGGELLGLGMAPRIDHQEHIVELGYIVAREWRGRGVAREALATMTDWAFATQHAVRVELKIRSDNEASRRVANAAGYTREETLRDVPFRDEIRVDLEVWCRRRSGA